MKPDGERYTVAVDFDGVIHSYTTPWVDAETILDPPVEGAIQWLREIAKHFAVVILTTRGRTKEGQRAVRHWLHEQGLEWGVNATVTAEKVPALIYLDDRAVRFAGVFPTRAEIHAARPWNRGGAVESSAHPGLRPRPWVYVRDAVPEREGVFEVAADSGAGQSILRSHFAPGVGFLWTDKPARVGSVYAWREESEPPPLPEDL